MIETLTLLVDGDPCGTHGCRRPAVGWIIAPEGDVIPGGHSCQQCADRVLAEYREKLDPRWTLAPGQIHGDPLTNNTTRRLIVRTAPDSDGITRRYRVA